MDDIKKSRKKKMVKKDRQITKNRQEDRYIEQELDKFIEKRYKEKIQIEKDR